MCAWGAVRVCVLWGVYGCVCVVCVCVCVLCGVLMSINDVCV